MKPYCVVASTLFLAMNAVCVAQQQTKRDIFDEVAKEKVPAVKAQAQTCEKNISFAWVSRSGEVVAETPGFADKWIAKNGKKHPSLCFDQSPSSHAHNYLLIFSRSQTAFSGIHPNVKTTTTRDTSPISGEGIATDNSGNTWNYSFDGTVSTTTTTTTHENLPYTDTSNILYLRSYTQYGHLISERWYSFVRRQGGDDGDTAAFNVVSSMRGIHFKQRLLEVVVKDIEKHLVQRDAP